MFHHIIGTLPQWGKTS